ncbi:archaea-specific SMC-related protein [Natrialbaceae archaeon A-CW2]
MSTGLTTDNANIPEEAKVEVENIGGIDKSEVTLQQGITVLTGRNATNRTSMLQAIMAALGSDVSSLKADADEGRATLRFGDQSYFQTLERHNGTVVTKGEPFLEDTTVADLFAFLLESNEARRSVARGDDLRELIMRPIDTDEIKRRIKERESEKRNIDQRLSDLDDLENRLPKLEEKRTRLTNEIETLEEELKEAEAELEAADADIDEKRDGKDKLENKLDELRSKRSELETARQKVETERESVDALESEHEDLEDRLNSLSLNGIETQEQLEAEIEALQEKKDTLSSQISQLQSTIQFNEELLNEPEKHFTTLNSQSGDDSDGDITEQLLADSEAVTCWTCGSSVPRSQIETTIEQLQTARKNRLEDRNEVSAELKERRNSLAEIEDTKSERRNIERRLESIEEEISDREERVDELLNNQEKLTETISHLENEIENLEDESYEAILDQHRGVNKLEFEIDRKENELVNTEEQIESIEKQLSDRDDLEQEREEVNDDLTNLRTRIEQIEKKAIESFNEHMDNVLDILGYENLDRIWIDRSKQSVREGRRTVEKSAFNLKIVRSTEDGSAYEDSIDNLSESEREVTGLVFGLAGYLVHDVYEELPFILLDSLEAIDAKRISDLIAYFESYAPYLVVALLLEDAEALEPSHKSVTDI